MPTGDLDSRANKPIGEEGPSPWLTVDEAAAYLRVSARTMRSLVAKEQVTAYRVGSGGNLRFKGEDLDDCLEPVSRRPGAMRAEEYPLLAELWDNEYDAAYDDL
jgi:excisionase family DNA binding protein